MTSTPLPDGAPLQTLYERPGSPGLGLPAPLAAAYGGDLGLPSPWLYGNFVASVDGVVSLRGVGESGAFISGRSKADRFVMGLLRACADAVLVGAGTFRATPGHLWHAERVYPEAAPLFAEVRAKLGLRPHPRLVLVSASGDLDLAHPALGHEATIVTTPAGEVRLRGRLPPSVRVSVVEADRIPLRSVLTSARREGAGRVLTEGGPSLIAGLLAESLLDELFLTTSPVLLGRFSGDGRKALVDGVDLAAAPRRLELVSAKRHGSFLFTRYGARLDA